MSRRTVVFILTGSRYAVQGDAIATRVLMGVLAQADVVGAELRNEDGKILRKFPAKREVWDGKLRDNTGKVVSKRHAKPQTSS